MEGKNENLNGSNSAVSGLTPEMNKMFEKVPFYNETLSAFKDGTGKAELKKRYMLKAIDETWINAIEDTLSSLDLIIRNPDALLLEKEKILPIEQTKRVTGRSVIHLAQHTDFINEIKDDGTVMPSKLLNVFQDETVLTYENKFINTLLNYLYGFVSRRYNAACECGEDEKRTTLELSREFSYGEDKRGKINLSVEVSEKPQENEVVKNYIYTTDLWRRVERIYKIVTSYMDSDFARQMGRNFVRPPIMRTNKILKNVEFRQCLNLWEFMEEYDNTGYEMLIQEDLEQIDDSCVDQFNNTLGLQYSIFRNGVRNEFEEEKLDYRADDNAIKTSFKDELDDLDESEFDVASDTPEEVALSESDAEIEKAIIVALAADNYFTAEEADGTEETIMSRGKILFRYRHSFLARLIYAQNPAQDFYTALKNELMAYKGVKNRTSWNYDSFNIGRKKCARINVKGKTVFLYLPLNPEDYPKSKYHHNDVSSKKKTADLPFLIKIRSERGKKYGLELIAEVMKKLGAVRLDNPPVADYHMPYATPEQLANRTPALVKIINPDVPAVKEAVSNTDSFSFNSVYRYSFLARLIQADESVQDYYGEIRNYLASFKKVRGRNSWGFESFRTGRKLLVKMTLRGKTISINFAADPKTLAEKYHIGDFSEKKSFSDVPARLKVKSKRGVKYAKEIIDIVMAQNGMVQGEIPKKSYRMPYKTTEELLNLEKPLVKLRK